MNELGPAAPMVSGGEQPQKLCVVLMPSKPLTPWTMLGPTVSPRGGPGGVGVERPAEQAPGLPSPEARADLEQARQLIHVVGVVLRRVLEAGEAAQVVLDRPLVEVRRGLQDEEAVRARVLDD